MDLAAASLLELVADGKTALLVGEITSVTKKESCDPGEECGTISCRIARALGSTRWHGPDICNITFARFANSLHRSMQSEGWNAVAVIMGTWVVIGIDDVAKPPAGDPPPTLPAKAVEAVENADAPLVQGIEKALVIEDAKDAAQRKNLIVNGFASNLTFLGDYCHFACGRLKRIPRPEAIDLELANLENAKARSESRRSAEVVLELELWKSDDPGDADNQRILVGFQNALRADDRELRRMALESMDRILFSNVPDDATAYRQKLTSGIVASAPFLADLKTCAAQGPAAQEATRVLDYFTAKKGSAM